MDTVDRQALPPPDEGRAQVQVGFVPPRDEVEQSLANICEPLLGIHPIGRQDNLFDLGIDSLTILRLTAEIEHRFQTHLPPAALSSSPTIAQLAALLRHETILPSWSSLVPIQPTGSKPPFFWIHGDCSSIPLSRMLGPDQPFYALEHQGQDGKPAVFTQVETIAGYYLREMQKVQAKGRYYVGGYSFGGIVALEVAQQITKQGEQVGLLALLDPPTLAKSNDSSSVESIAWEPTRASLPETVRRHVGNLAALPARERIAYLRPHARNKIAKVFKLPLIERSVKGFIYRICLALNYRLPLFVRSQYIFDIYGRARRGYTSQPYCGRVILFKGEARRYNQHSDWEEVIVGDREVHVVNANHEQMREEPYVPLWAETLKRALAQARVGGSLLAPSVKVGDIPLSESTETKVASK